MEKVMKELPLSNDIKSALIDRKGRMVGYLLLAETYEKGQWDQMTKISQVMRIQEEKLPDLYLEACRWSNMFMNGDG